MFIKEAPLIDAVSGTRLTDDHEQTVRNTLPVIGAHIEEIASVFYTRMFSAHPELESDLFNRGNQRSGEQQKALAASVATFASALVNPQAPSAAGLLARIANKHVSLGITEQQYEIVHEYLFAAISEVLGDAVTPEVAEAWDEVYWLLAQSLIEAERSLYDSAGVTPGDVFRNVNLVARETLSDRVTQLSFDCTGDPGAFGETRPGQYTSIGVHLPDGARQLRQYSLVDWTDGGFTIAVQRDGEVSNYLLDELRIGDPVQATLPAGGLVLDVGDAVPVVLVSSGIGSTPMVGMLSAMVAEGAQRSVTVIHADRNEADDAQRDFTADLVDSLIAQGSEVKLITRYANRNQRVIINELDIPSKARWYLCGGDGFLRSIREQISEVEEQIQPLGVHFELFSPNDWLLS